MPVRYQLVIDCADPDRLARFWAAALGYELAPAPAGFATWNDFYREMGVPEEDLVDGADRISDPAGHGPSIWFHVVPDAKAVKNRLHFDIRASRRVDGPDRESQEASRRGGKPAGRPGRHDHWPTVRGRQPLRGRDEGPRRQRVRYQLTLSGMRAGHGVTPRPDPPAAIRSWTRNNDMSLSSVSSPAPDPNTGISSPCISRSRRVPGTRAPRVPEDRFQGSLHWPGSTSAVSDLPEGEEPRRRQAPALLPVHATRPC